MFLLECVVTSQISGVYFFSFFFFNSAQHSALLATGQVCRDRYFSVVTESLVREHCASVVRAVERAERLLCPALSQPKIFCRDRNSPFYWPTMSQPGISLS